MPPTLRVKPPLKFSLCIASTAMLVLACEGDILGAGGSSPFGSGKPIVSLAPPAKVDLAAKVKPSSTALRALSNREYLTSVSDLFGIDYPKTLIQPWAATPGYSGFDSIGWANFDTKLVRDRLATLEVILDGAMSSPKVMTCSATSSTQVIYDACAKSIVERLAERAFRRPLTPEEKTLLTTAYTKGVQLAQCRVASELLKEGVRAALATVLLAPQFQIKAELATDGFTGERELTAYELASRLSYFITNSLPDDELWAAAKDGSLVSPDVLQKQAERLLAANTDRFVENFLGQWFGFRELDTATDPLEQAMFQETRLTLREILVNDMPAISIVQPRFTYLNSRLATHYGVPGEFNEFFKRVTMTERGGILAQASVLRLTSNSVHETSPIRRGRWVQGRLLCKTIPPPPPELSEQISNASMAVPANATVKQRLAMHEKAGAACHGCHQFMDPIGIGLEGFDSLGKKRTTYEDMRPVETDSNLFGTPFANFEGLNELLYAMPEVKQCAAEKIAVHALGRVIQNTGEDADLIAYLASESGKQLTFKDIVVKMVRSVAFRRVVHGVTP